MSKEENRWSNGDNERKRTIVAVMAECKLNLRPLPSLTRLPICDGARLIHIHLADDVDKAEELWASRTPRTQLSVRPRMKSQEDIRPGSRRSEEQEKSASAPLSKTSRGCSGAAFASLLEESLPELPAARARRVSELSPLGRLREVVQSDFMRVQTVMQKFDHDGSGEIDKFEVSMRPLLASP